MDAPKVEAALETLGYAVLVESRAAWSECLLVRDGERWLGRGRDLAEALQDAVRQACPSYLARIALEQLVERTREAAAEVDATSVAAVDSEEEPQLPPPESGENGAQDGEEEERSLPAMLVDAPAAPAPPVTESRPRRLEDEDRSSDDVREGVDALHALKAKMVADEDELAQHTPARQRLVLLAWISCARAVQHEHPSNIVADEVRAVARRLGTLARRWWPGSVGALQLASLPEDVGRQIPTSEVLTSWAAVQRAAESALAAMEARDEAAGRDAFGWADRPVAISAKRASERLRAVLERLEPLDAQDPPLEERELVRCAEELRALRGCSETETWSEALGALRRWAHRSHLVELGRVLDPAWVPPRAPSLAPRPTVDPVLREREVTEVVITLPNADDRVAIRDWLVRALPLTDTHHRTITEVVRPFAPTIATLGPSDFAGAGRRVHRRLRKLQESLVGEDSPSSSISERPSMLVSSPPDDADDSEEVDPNVVARTRGLRAAFVTNRNDRELEARLLEVLQLESLTWVESEPRRIEALTESIAHHRFDLVMAATGFLAHKVDYQLMRACRSIGVPYVRANRGRVGACVRALARDLLVA